MQIFTKENKAIVTALSPISHGRIRVKDEKDANGEDNVLRFRTMPFLYKDDSGNVNETDLYCVSGNAMRGLGRRLMFHHTIDLLDLDLEKILPNFSAIERRYVANLFENGGSTPKGSHATVGVPAKTYDEILAKLPMLDLLGGVYITHHFNSSCAIGNLILRTKETQALLTKHNVFEDTDSVPSLLDVHTDTVRHTKMRSARDASEYPDNMADEATKKNLKSAAIFGADVLPAGTTFYWQTSLKSTPNEGTLIAYDAFLALIAKFGSIGGMSAKGYGMVNYAFGDAFDVKAAIKKYDEYTLAHKDDIIEGLQLLANDFKYVLNTEKEPKKSTKKGK